MQWQRADSLETVAAMALLSVAFGGLVYILWPRDGRVGTLALGLVAALPLASFAAGFARQLPFENALIAAGDRQWLRLAVPSTLALAIAVGLAFRPAIFARWLRRGLLAISFVAVVVVGRFIAAAAYDPPVIEIDRAVQAAAPSACPSVVALLFDELSFAYLYEGTDVRADYPALRRLAAGATNYLDARAPADETLVALPGYLSGRHVDRLDVEDATLMEVRASGQRAPFRPTAPDSLFATARALGYRTEMGGYYLPYCSLLGDLVDACRSFSFYNASLVGDGFSPLDPIRTALIMWPRQFPFGLVKNRPFAALQRGLVDRLSAFARRPLPDGQPVFRFVHFSVPHLPFVFGRDGYAPPLNPLRTSPDDYYVRQLGYVDRLVGDIVGGMQRDGTFDDSTLVILADHGYRFGGRERDKLHIPFIVKRAGQTTRADVAERQRGELLLRNIVGGSCEAR
jgi:hypothetical protein